MILDNVVLSHPCVLVTKQYNLVSVSRRRRSAAGKVTVGLASQWPCDARPNGYAPAAQWIGTSAV